MDSQTCRVPGQVRPHASRTFLGHYSIQDVRGIPRPSHVAEKLGEVLERARIPRKVIEMAREVYAGLAVVGELPAGDCGSDLPRGGLVFGEQSGGANVGSRASGRIKADPTRRTSRLTDLARRVHRHRSD
jgi:hypothetical protein